MSMETYRYLCLAVAGFAFGLYLASLARFRRTLFDQIISALESGRYQVQQATSARPQSGGRLMVATCMVDGHALTLTSTGSSTPRPRFTLDVRKGGVRVPYSFGIGSKDASVDEPRIAAVFGRVWLRGGRT